MDSCDLPGWHALQFAEAGRSWYLPAMHSMHALLAAAMNFPAGQSTHAVAPAKRSVDELWPSE
jgi:hypothetical protein